MNTPFEEPTIHELATRLTELEQANAHLQAELANVRAERAAEEQISTQTPTQPIRPQRSSRRKMLTKGLGVAVASVGAGAMLELGGGTASAASSKRGLFASSVAGKPAVNATGTNGADGIDASSDSGTGVSATSTSGTGLVATSTSGLAGQFTGDVNIDNNLSVNETLSTGTLFSGAGRFIGSGTSTPAVIANGGGGFGGGGTGVSGTGGSTDSLSTGGTGVSGTGGGGGTDGTGVFGQSITGTGVHGKSSSGLAGLFDGNV